MGVPGGGLVSTFGVGGGGGGGGVEESVCGLPLSFLGRGQAGTKAPV